MQKTQLTIQTRQNLKISPGVQLALKFLQLPAMELQSWLRQELLKNPLLEMDDGLEEEEEPEVGSEDGPEWDPQVTAPEWTDADSFDTPSLPRGVEETTAMRSEDRSVWQPTSLDLLRDQLHLIIRDREELEVADYWLGCLDERGYLSASAEEVAADLKVGLLLAQAALERLRSLDPPGVGAVDLRDCLRLQLLRLGAEGTLPWILVDEYFEELSHARHSFLRRRLGLSKEALQMALESLRQLQPRPLRGWEGDRETEIVVPDMMITEIDGRFEVFPVDRVLPRLRLNQAYRPWVGNASPPAGVSGNTEVYLQDRLRAARWILQSLDRRRDTMLRVMRAIVEEQAEFFRHGPSALGPLTLQVIARKVSLHESTVARVTQSKYVQTPVGVVSLKSFFSTRIVRQKGGATSGRAVRERIRILIDREDCQEPLTDEQIAAILETEGIRLARRTIAKYRDHMRIDRAQLRKRVPILRKESEDHASEVGSPPTRRKRIA